MAISMRKGRLAVKTASQGEEKSEQLGCERGRDERLDPRSKKEGIACALSLSLSHASVEMDL